MASRQAEQVIASSRNRELYRFERKFVTSDCSLEEVGLIIRSHPAMFRIAYPARRVNNIYFDTAGFSRYIDNIQGSASRYKVRVRWYGGDGKRAPDPKLEIKFKEGFLGIKETHPIADLEIGGGLAGRSLDALMSGSGVPPARRAAMGDMRPVIANRYHRRYYMSADGRFRITLDSDIRYYRMRRQGGLFDWPRRDDGIVVELKYAFADDGDAVEIVQHLPFRVVRNSKYVNAVEQIYF